MDDFVLSNLNESRNEWCNRLVSILTPLIMEGIRSIFNESWKVCLDNNETNKYLMTFQNLLSRVPKWNNNIIEEERKRIIERSGCNYLEDLITCVHIIQLKVLTSIRVGNKQKKIDISIPNLDTFIHKVYIIVARKVYMNVYLFEKTISQLQFQKYNRELELIVQESILIAIRESIPTESIIMAYIDESVEHDEQVIVENIENIENIENNENDNDNINNETYVNVDTNNIITHEEEPENEIVPTIKNIDNTEVVSKLSFNDIDSVLDSQDIINDVDAPKTIERLEDISTSRAIQRKLEEEEADADDERIKISTDNVELKDFTLLEPEEKLVANDDVILNDVIELS